VIALAHLITWHLEDPFCRKKDGFLRRAAVQRMEAVFGKNNPWTLVVMGILAQSYFRCRALQKAKDLNERRRKGLADTVGELDPFTMAAANDLATTCTAIAIRKACHLWVPRRVSAEMWVGMLGLPRKLTHVSMKVGFNNGSFPHCLSKFR
jgi:hypothetical protein